MKYQIARIDLGGVNCYLIKTASGFILVDTGGHLVLDKEYTDRRAVLEKALDAFGCSAESLNLIILTHGDNDHTFNAAYFREKYHTKIAMHADDKKLVESPDLPLWMSSFQYRSLPFRLIFRIMKKPITSLTEKILKDFVPFTPDVLLTNGFILSEYGLDATVIHAPGHTDGSAVILLEGGELIAGDLFANNKKPMVAPNAVNFTVLNKSIPMLNSYSITMVYPGHGIPFDFKSLNLQKQ